MVERKIGEKFGYVESFIVDHDEILDGYVDFPVKVVRLQVVEQQNERISCKGCYFESNKSRCTSDIDLLGQCSPVTREDNTDVIFKDISEEYE